MNRLIVTTLLSLACFAADAEWTRIFNEASSNTSVDADLTTFKREGDITKLWTRINYDKPQNFEGTSYQSTINLTQVDCKEDLYRSVFSNLHEGKNGEGKKLKNVNQPNAEWLQMPPQTIARDVAKWICAYKP